MLSNFDSILSNLYFKVLFSCSKLDKINSNNSKNILSHVLTLEEMKNLAKLVHLFQ